jgi:tRNA A58 N-methylase Trm61
MADRQCPRALALSAVLAYFPNTRLTIRGLRKVYDPEVVRTLPRELTAVRRQLRAELRSLGSTKKIAQTRFDV